MNAVAPHVVRATPAKASLADGLDHIHRVLLRPFRVSDQLDVARWQPLVGKHRYRFQRAIPDLASAEPFCRQWTLDAAHEVVDELPAAAALTSAVADLRQVLEQSFRVADSRWCIGLLIDAFPNGHPSGAYPEILLHEAKVGNYPAPVVAAACSTITRTSRFLPSAAEFIAACEERKGFLQRTQEQLEEGAEVRAAADRLLEWARVNLADELTVGEADDAIPF